MKSPQVVFGELCDFVYEKLHVIGFSKQGRTKFCRKCAFGTACVSIRKSVSTSKDRIRFTVELKVFVDALDWIKRNPDNYWEKNRPDINLGLYKFSPKDIHVDEWWDVSDEGGGRNFVDQMSFDLIENVKTYVDLYESRESILNLWLFFVGSKDAGVMRKIEYAGLLYGFEKKEEGQRFLENLLLDAKDNKDRRLVVRYIENFSKKFY